MFSALARALARRTALAFSTEVSRTIIFKNLIMDVNNIKAQVKAKLGQLRDKLNSIPILQKAEVSCCHTPFLSRKKNKLRFSYDW